MIKVFTTTMLNSSGDYLTREFEKWVNNFPHPIEIISYKMKTTRGYVMLVVHYKKLM